MSSVMASCVLAIEERVNRTLSSSYVDVEALFDLHEEINATVELGPQQRALMDGIEQRIVSVARKETDDAIEEWRSGGCSARQLAWKRDELRVLAQKTRVGYLRSVLFGCARNIKDALDKGSRDSAMNLLQRIENDLDGAEEILASADEPDERELNAVSNSILSVRRAVEQISKVPHVKHVGWPAVAKERGVTVAELDAGITRRIDDAMKALDVRQSDYDAHRDAIQYAKLQKAAEQQAVLAAQQRERTFESVIAAMERRSKQAAAAARQCLEHLRLGNVGAAKSCLDEVRRRDYGIPPELQAEYAIVLRARS